MAAMAGTTAVLAVVAALTPLFLSSASSAALQRELEGRCPTSFGASVSGFGEDLDRSRELLVAAKGDDPQIGPPRLTLSGTLVEASNPSGEGASLRVRFLAREGYREHIELIAGEHGDGVYLDHIAAEQMGLGPGDSLLIRPRGVEPLTVPVVAIYRNLSDATTHDFWCAVEGDLAVNAMGDLPPPPVLVDTDFFEDREVFHAVYAEYSGSAAGAWELPLRLDGLTIAAAERSAATFETVHEELDVRLLTDLPIVTKRVEALTEALRTSIVPLAGVVLLAALALVGGAGSYWADRKRTELEYLSALGFGPGMIALKAVLELLPAMVVGVGLGWGAANLLVTVVGPSPDFEAAARTDSTLAAATAAAVGVVAVAVVVARRASSLLDQSSRSRRTFGWRIPLLLATVAGATLVRGRIGDSAVTIEENQLVGSVDPLVLFFPLLVFLSVALAVTEMVLRSFPLLRRLGGSGHALYLATRRIVSAPALVIALVVGAALPVATLLYATSLTRSATSTIDAKGRSFVGGDISTPVFEVIDPPGELAAVSTVVAKVERATLNGETVDVLGVDRQTFAGGAFWDPGYSHLSLETILATVEGDAVGGPLPAFVANGAASSGELRMGSRRAEILVQDHIEAFPGSRRDRPLIIVDRERLLEVLAAQGRVTGVRYLMWTMDRTEQEVEAAMAEAKLGYAYTVAAATTLDQLKFAAIVWTFDFLEVYAMLGGVIAIGAVLLYVDTRQRSRNLSYALARRMGLTRSDHLAAGVIELGSLAVVGVGSGMVAALLAARSLFRVLDAIPETPPGPRWIGAVDISLIALALAVGVAVLGAILAQRTADTADTSELLRHGG